MCSLCSCSGGIRQKWEVGEQMKAEWKGRAEALFFVEKKSIVDIENEIGVSRKSISAHLRPCPEYEMERNRRKVANAANRTEHKRDWDRKNRPFSPGPVTQDTIRREHEMAVAILSREKYR